jgi:2,3-dihydroxyphenylpropionate 1,2-dioxygenase
MGRIVFAAAMSHVLDPDYDEKNCGAVGRRTVETLMEHVADLGRALDARRPDALVIVADDHLNAFSFNAVPTFCVRIGRHVDRMAQKEATAFDKLLDRLPQRYPLHEELANRILEDGLEDGFDLASSWEAPLDHAFLSPATAMYPSGALPPLVPIWVNCFVAPQPTPRRCFALGQPSAGSAWPPSSGMSHEPR